MNIYDTHAHYYDKKFNEIDGGADALLEKLFSDGVKKIINVGTNPDTNMLVLEQAKRYEDMYAAVGIHPEDCEYLSGDIESEVEKVKRLIFPESDRKERKIVAIGEIGLDYHMENCDRERQKHFFEAQMMLAEESGLPVIIHDREAHGDCFETVLRHPKVRGVFHSYSGSADMAKELTRRGWYISFSGTVTFKNAPKVREVAASLPSDKILCETDAPYLAPHPYRGQINNSSFIKYTLTSVAEARNITYDEAEKITAENARRLFGI